MGGEGRHEPRETTSEPPDSQNNLQALLIRLQVSAILSPCLAYRIIESKEGHFMIGIKMFKLIRVGIRYLNKSRNCSKISETK